jgi:hypothetical protein
MALTVRGLPASRRAYERLLRLLPREFRAAFGEPAVQTFVDMFTAEVKAAGARGVVSVWSRVLPDLLWASAREWTSRMLREDRHGRPPAAARYAATIVPAAAALLVLYSQLRYPADLARPEYAIGYGLVVVLLGALAVALLVGRLAAPLVVLCGLATAPGWVSMFMVGRPGVAVIGLASAMSLVVLAGAAGGRRPAALVRAGATAGALAGIVLLIVTMLDGLASMGSVWHDRVYVAEFVRSGQTSLPAYVLGERVYGAVIIMIMAIVVGAGAGLMAGATRSVIEHIKHLLSS